MFFAFWRFFQFFHSFSVTAGRARLSPGRHNRNQTARSVWSAWSLLPLSNRATHPTAGASSTHSIRFARHDRPCHPSVQFAPYPPKICAKKQDFRLYYSARRRIFGIVARRAEDRRALPAVTDTSAVTIQYNHEWTRINTNGNNRTKRSWKAEALDRRRAIHSVGGSGGTSAALR